MKDVSISFVENKNAFQLATENNEYTVVFEFDDADIPESSYSSVRSQIETFFRGEHISKEKEVLKEVFRVETIEREVITELLDIKVNVEHQKVFVTIGMSDGGILSCMIPYSIFVDPPAYITEKVDCPSCTESHKLNSQGLNPKRESIYCPKNKVLFYRDTEVVSDKKYYCESSQMYHKEHQPITEWKPRTYRIEWYNHILSCECGGSISMPSLDESVECPKCGRTLTLTLSR